MERNAEGEGVPLTRGLYCPPLIPTGIQCESVLAQKQAKIGNSIPVDSGWNAHRNAYRNAGTEC